MNITFFLGNGFDLQCGLKTSYIDVKKAYLESGNKSKIKDTLIKHFNNDKENWSDFEEGIYSNSNKFYSLDELRLCVEDFRAFIMEYLQKESDKVSEELINEKCVEIKERFIFSINNFMNNLTPNDSEFIRNHHFSTSDELNFITLNYTDLLDKILKCLFKSQNEKALVSNINYGECVHAHGEIKNNNIILGADNNTQFNDFGTYPNLSQSRSLTKKDFINEIDKFGDESAQEILYKTDVLVIYGASLGNSDLMWKKRIIMWLKQNKNRHLIKLHRLKDIPFYSDLSRRKDVEIEYVNKFSKELEITDEDIKKRIHVPQGINIFVFKDLFFNEK